MNVEFTSVGTPVRVSYIRAGLITVVALSITYLLTGVSLTVLPVSAQVLDEILFRWFAVATIVPIIVAFPVAIVLQRERLKLAQALKQLADVHAELAHRSRIDPLTHVLTRDTFLKDMDVAKSASAAGAMLMIDVDHFKSVNDTFGHQAGDTALVLVAAAIQRAVRHADPVGRVGGEEFGVFIAGDDFHLACGLAERIRRDISQIQFYPDHHTRHQITASIGVAMGDQSVEAADLIRLADQSLYRAKHRGRNRVDFQIAA